MKNNHSLFWVLGTDDDLHWHQRIIESASLEKVKNWWFESLGRMPEILIDEATLSGGVSLLGQLNMDIPEGERLFGVWVKDQNQIQLKGAVGETVEQIEQEIKADFPSLEILAVVQSWPLIETVARFRAIHAQEMKADEIV